MTRIALVPLTAAALVLSIVLLVGGHKWSFASVPYSECAALINWIRYKKPIATFFEGQIGDSLEEASARRSVDAFAHQAVAQLGWPSHVQFASYEPNATISSVLQAPAAFRDVYVVIVPGSGKPVRRVPSQPFVSASPQVASALGFALLSAVELGARGVELATGRALFPFSLQAAALGGSCASGSGPCAIWESSSGSVLVDESLVQTWTRGISSGAFVEAFAALFFDAVAAVPGQLQEADGSRPEPRRARDEHQRLALPAPVPSCMGKGRGCVESRAPKHSKIRGEAPLVAASEAAQRNVAGSTKSPAAALTALRRAFANAAPAALAAAGAAGRGGMPLWACIACPLALGLAAPLVFNAALAALAEKLCQDLALDEQSCVDLWYGAFALAGILSLAAAIPIAYVCRLKECFGRAGAA
ncbi:hypothetical protein H632_c6p3 [Helicosporidium sp. ATCC 50920]|nr:hypothetical protein H632_c6p3 [Helicosporidium sp. ATCC 50920]|eukprot:KDD77159.1 hypothetical protein H632_c6p3 [Helicosporidium sp. ATCC 50920]